MPAFSSIPIGWRNIIFNMSSNEKTRLLLFGDSMIVLKALEQYIQFVPGLSHYEVVDVVEYGCPLLTLDKLRSVDIMLYSLYRRYGARQRAEGVTSLQTRLKFGKKGLIYCFGISSVAANPLVWDITSPMTLKEKLAKVNNEIIPEIHMQELQKYFSDDIFTVDGH